jgi:hypothetical protein
MDYPTGLQWSQLGRTERIALGKTLVRDRLERQGCAVASPRSLIDGRLAVRTPSGRALEVFVSTQKVGGYVFWTKQRLELDPDRFAAIVLLIDGEDPELYLVPTTEWRTAGPPFTNRDNLGKRSAPEYGISLAHSSLPMLERYIWTEGADLEHLL